MGKIINGNNRNLLHNTNKMALVGSMIKVDKENLIRQMPFPSHIIPILLWLVVLDGGDTVVYHELVAIVLAILVSLVSINGNIQYIYINKYIGCSSTFFYRSSNLCLKLFNDNCLFFCFGFCQGFQNVKILCHELILKIYPKANSHYTRYHFRREAINLYHSKDCSKIDHGGRDKRQSN